MSTTIALETHTAREVVDITPRVEALVSGVPSGSCHLFLRHTTAGLMVITSEKDGRLLDVNDTLAKLLAYSREELLGHTVEELGIWDAPDSAGAEAAF